MTKHINTALDATLPELDLSMIRKRLLEKEGWNETMASQAEQEYRRFLYLIKTNPGKSLVPTEEIDEFWHLHILDTAKYAKDCEALFGYFLHHNPNLKKGSEELTRRFGETNSLYEKIFSPEKRSGVGTICGGESNKLDTEVVNERDRWSNGTCSGRCRSCDTQ